MRWPLRKKWAELKARAEQAAAEKEAAAARLEETHKEVVRPLRDAAKHNRFADMLRDSLLRDGD